MDESSRYAGVGSPQANMVECVASIQRWRLQQKAANHLTYNRRSSTDGSAEPYTRLDWTHPTTTQLQKAISACDVILPLLPWLHGYRTSAGSVKVGAYTAYSRYPQITRLVYNGRTYGVAVLSLCLFAQPNSRYLFRLVPLVILGFGIFSEGKISGRLSWQDQHFNYFLPHLALHDSQVRIKDHLYKQSFRPRNRH
jgi:hypothetical protein